MLQYAAPAGGRRELVRGCGLLRMARREAWRALRPADRGGARGGGARWARPCRVPMGRRATAAGWAVGARLARPGSAAADERCAAQRLWVVPHAGQCPRVVQRLV